MLSCLDARIIAVLWDIITFALSHHSWPIRSESIYRI